MSRRLLCIVLVWLLLAALRAQAETAAALSGDWVLPDGSAVIRISAAQGDNLFVGEVIALRQPYYSIVESGAEPGQLRRDRNNPQAAERQRPLLGLQIAQDLRFDGRQWAGRIYDPNSGKTYRCVISLIGEDYARVRGYMGISLLGKTMYWQRLASYREQSAAMLGLDQR